MKDQGSRTSALNLMQSSPATYLTTLADDGFPHTRAMLNLRNAESYPGLVAYFDPHQDSFWVYFTTNTSSAKVAQIRKNPGVSAYYCQPEQFHGLMLAGRIEIVSDQAVKEALWQAGWERYYPQGMRDPDYAILLLKPTIATGWHLGARFEFSPVDIG